MTNITTNKMKLWEFEVNQFPLNFASHEIIFNLVETGFKQSMSSVICLINQNYSYTKDAGVGGIGVGVQVS